MEKKKNREKIKSRCGRSADCMAVKQWRKSLYDIDLSEYADVLFIGKSIGIMVGITHAKHHCLDVSQDSLHSVGSHLSAY